MGCFPFGRGNTDGYGKRNGKRWKKNTLHRYETEGRMYGHPAARPVIYYNGGPVVVAHPEVNHHHHHHQEAELVPSDHVYATVVAAGVDEAPSPPPRARVRFTLPEGQEEVLHAAIAHEGKVRSSEPPSSQHYFGPDANAPHPMLGQRYVPSPLPGQLEYYNATPIHDGVYRLGTDANRFTTMFSEENPNACIIA